MDVSTGVKWALLICCNSRISRWIGGDIDGEEVVHELGDVAMDGVAANVGADSIFAEELALA